MFDRASYDLKRLKRRQQRTAEFQRFLGSVCRRCGGTKELQIEYVGQRRLFDVHQVWGLPQPEQFAELAKSQLVCGECRTRRDTGGHGSWGMYRRRGCRCKVCRKFVVSNTSP